jgi:hypothetical protein
LWCFVVFSVFVVAPVIPGSVVAECSVVVVVVGISSAFAAEKVAAEIPARAAATSIFFLEIDIKNSFE